MFNCLIFQCLTEVLDVLMFWREVLSKHLQAYLSVNEQFRNAVISHMTLFSLRDSYSSIISAFESTCVSSECCV